MKTSWVKGPREPVTGRRGKNGGQVFTQRVVKWLKPKEA